MGIRQPFDRESTATPPPLEGNPSGAGRNVAATYSLDEKPTNKELVELRRALAYKSPFTELKKQLERLSSRLNISVADVLLRSEFVWYERSKSNMDGMNRTQWTNYGTLLHEAVRENNFDLVTYLLSPHVFEESDKLLRFLEQRDYLGMTALPLAIQLSNSMEMIKFLFYQGADIRATDIHGWTPMHHAMDKRGIETAKLLYSKDKSLMNKAAHSTHDTPLHILIRRGHVEAIREVMRTFGREYLDWFRLNDLGLSAFDLAKLVIGDAEFLRELRASVLVDGWKLKRQRARDNFERARKDIQPVQGFPTGKEFLRDDDEVVDGSWEDFTKAPALLV